MVEQTIKNIFTHHGSYHHTEPVESGSIIIVKGGNCTIEGPVGDNVSLEVDGDVVLLDDAGDNLRVMANGSFGGKSVGQNADMTALGKASVVYLGYGSTLRSTKGAGVTNKETKCGEYNVAIQDGFINMTRKWPSEVDDSSSCRVVRFDPPSTPQ